MSDLGLYMSFVMLQILTYLHHWLLVSLEQVVMIVGLEFQVYSLSWVAIHYVCHCWAGCLVYCAYVHMFLFGKHLQYKPVVNAIIPSADIKAPMVKNILTFTENQ